METLRTNHLEVMPLFNSETVSQQPADDNSNKLNENLTFGASTP